MTFKTVNRANQALDCYMGLHGHSSSGGHFNRPDGTRGPAVLYSFGKCSVMFTLDRDEEGWKVSGCWLTRRRLSPIRMTGLVEGFVATTAERWTDDVDYNAGFRADLEALPEVEEEV